MDNADIKLHVTDENGDYTVTYCDEVNLYSADPYEESKETGSKKPKKGKNEKSFKGGSIGIRKGHIKSVIALCEGEISASLKGKQVYKREILTGIASVENDTVTVICTYKLSKQS